MTDVELDARVTALEENGGNNVQNGVLRHPSNHFNTVKRSTKKII